MEASKASIFLSPPLPLHLKARTLFRPLHRLHLSIPVQIRAQIAVSYYLCFRIIHQQGTHQYAERVALPFGSCVFWVAIMVQSAFVADSYRVSIVATGVGADPLDRACGQDQAVTADEEMIADAIKSTLAVRGLQGLLGKGAVLARGTTMYHNQVDLSHLWGGLQVADVHGVGAECT